MKPRVTMTEPASYPKHAAKKSGRAAKRFEVEGGCVCGDVVIALDFPAFWAWHDHSSATRRAHGAAYATYVGCWRKHVRVIKGQRSLRRFEEGASGAARQFCSRCGTPIFYERPRSKNMIDIPRALFTSRTGREPRYHLNIEEAVDWAYRGEPLAPLKNYPGVVWNRGKSRRRANELDDVAL